MFSFLFIGLFEGGDVTMKIDVGQQINAGKEITVKVTLKKGAINGFSRFQLELPVGITATSADAANADFSFKDQKVRLVWLRMPEDDEVTFTFNIQCHERLKGNFELKGKFSYLQENERKNVDLQPQTLTIIPNPALDPALLVDINDFGKLGLPQYMQNLGNIACVRQKPALNEAAKEYVVTLLVNKEALKKFAKIEETVPAGFTAVSLDSKSGIFTFKENKVKFLWMNLPAESYFTVSYKLLPLKGTTAVLAKINGVFSFITDDKTQSVNVVEKEVSLANLTAASVKDILNAPVAGAAPVVVATTVVPPVTKPVEPKPVTVVVKPQPEKVEKPVVKVEPPVQEKPVVVVQNIPKVKPETKPEVKTPDQTSDLLEPKGGVYYRIQVAAGHRPVDVKSYFRKYKLENSVIKEMHDGWIKYSVGAFNQYRDARDYRVHIWNTTTIADAFVSAYNNGKRITVQEALMIANQKWIQ